MVSQVRPRSGPRSTGQLSRGMAPPVGAGSAWRPALGWADVVPAEPCLGCSDLTVGSLFTSQENCRLLSEAKEGPIEDSVPAASPAL